MLTFAGSQGHKRDRFSQYQRPLVLVTLYFDIDWFQCRFWTNFSLFSCQLLTFDGYHSLFSILGLGFLTFLESFHIFLFFNFDGVGMKRKSIWCTQWSHRYYTLAEVGAFVGELNNDGWAWWLWQAFKEFLLFLSMCQVCAAWVEDLL